MDLIINFSNFFVIIFLLNKSYNYLNYYITINFHKNGDWGLGIGDWGLGIGEWA